MGVLHVYFHAVNAEAALQADVKGPLVGFTTVESKVADPHVALGKLVALIAGVAWSPGLVGARVISPSPATKPTSAAAYALLPKNSPWRTGPWLYDLSVRARDILADVDASRRAELAVQWGRSDEFRRIPEKEKGLFALLVSDLSDLAKQARKAGHRIYCWSSL